MLYFPQLLPGAAAQYPLVKRRVQRTITSETRDGRLFKLLDSGWAMVQWDLTFKALTNQEREDLETFFYSVEGKLGEFTFLDPTDNLLLHSENLTAAEWLKGSSLSLEADAADPYGGTSATRIVNAGSTSETLQQTIAGPGGFLYCFSVFAKSSTPTSLTLFRIAGGVEDAVASPVHSNWKRLVHSGQSLTNVGSVTFGIRIEAGTSVDVFGFQAEAQRAPSDYRKTTSRCGVYPRARLEDDILSFASYGPEQHSCTLRVVAFPAN